MEECDRVRVEGFESKRMEVRIVSSIVIEGEIVESELNRIRDWVSVKVRREVEIMRRRS